MFPLPPQPGGLPHGLLRHRCCIYKDLHLSRLVLSLGLLNKPARQTFQAFLDQIMIVLVARINRHGAPIRAADNRHGIFIRGVALRQHDDRARLRPQNTRITAPMAALRHPPHLPMIAFFKKLLQPLWHLWHVPGATDLASDKPLGNRPLHQSRLQVSTMFHLAGKILGGELSLAKGKRGQTAPSLCQQLRHNASRSEIEISIMCRRTKTRYLVSQDRAKGRAGFDLGIPVLDHGRTVPIHIRNIVK